VVFKTRWHGSGLYCLASVPFILELAVDKNKVFLAKTLEAAQIPIKLDTYADRRALQYIVYLLQNVGVKLGYKFWWREYGLFSHELLSDLFGIVDDLHHDKTFFERWTLDEISKATAVTLCHSLAHENGEEYLQSPKLEVLASVLFTLKTEQASASEPNTIAEMLNRFDIVCTPLAVEEALQSIKNYGF